MGHLGHAEVPSFLASVDVAVAPYPDLPGFFYSPLKVYEYLAAGIPVVASNIGQLTELVAPWGRLSTAGSAGALAAAIRATLEDPAAAARAREARGWVLANHSWDERAQRLTGMLEEDVRALAR
jgi:glycosyltransferase involved in cell wall biosynthesis